MIYDKTRALEPGYYELFEMTYKPALEKDRQDAERYRRLRENWIDCDELDLVGRLAVIDDRIDDLLSTKPLLGAPPVTRVMMQMCDKCGRGVMDADECTEDDNRCPFHGGDKSLLIMRPLEIDTGTAVKTGVEIKSHNDHPLRHFDRTCPACISQLNHVVDDYDLTSNDTRRGD